jgi:chemotaxis methyl-accepting protein methylase
MWSHLPPAAHESHAVQNLGHLIHRFVCDHSERNGQAAATHFLRNLPLICTLAEMARDLSNHGNLKLAIIGCGAGPEVYSNVWMLRKLNPDVVLSTVAMDISPEAIEAAKTARYKPGSPELCKDLPPDVQEGLFEQLDDQLQVKPHFTEGIRWLVGDARDPNLLDLIGLQDVVIANNFLIHMKDSEARPCMIALLSLLRPGGLFLCRGVDLDVRESVAHDQGLQPITTRIEEIHEADPGLDARNGWPWKYWGLEPLDKTRKNWPGRYAAIFRKPYAA